MRATLGLLLHDWLHVCYGLPKVGAWLAVEAAREPVCRDMKEGRF